MKPKLICFILLILVWSCQTENGDHQPGKTEHSIPFLKKAGNTSRLIVDGHPFILLSGELHNSTSSSPEYIANIFPRLREMNLNSVIASVSWELFEPREGDFDFDLIDSLLFHARKNDLKLTLLWFGSWKNGESTYVPLWVKKDTDRFFRVKDRKGRNKETVSVFSDVLRKADAKAFGVLMDYLKRKDPDHTVIMVQIENEVGIFQDIDYNDMALHRFHEPVPGELITYLEENKDHLNPYIYNAWSRNGFLQQGSWPDIFADSASAKEFFMAWHYASFMNDVAKEGKNKNDLPMYVNAWLVQKPEDKPGVYPNGGPVARVMDVYKAAGKQIDFVSPDIYLPDFKQITSLYHRYDNPLFIPETRARAGYAFYAIAQHGAIGFSPFGIEDAIGDPVFAGSYQTLGELLPLITKYSGTDSIRGILKEGDERETTVDFKDVTFRIKYPEDQPSCFGLIIQRSGEKYIMAGMNFTVTVHSNRKDTVAYIGQIREGEFVDGIWQEGRTLNGDESINNRRFALPGRKFRLHESHGDETYSRAYFDPEERDNSFTAPGIYDVTIYFRK